jgi:hypothetical protein
MIRKGERPNGPGKLAGAGRGRRVSSFQAWARLHARLRAPEREERMAELHGDVSGRDAGEHPRGPT